MKAAVYYENRCPECLSLRRGPRPGSRSRRDARARRGRQHRSGDTLNRLGGPLVSVPHIVATRAPAPS